MPHEEAEQARAAWLSLFPGGFEEAERGGAVELAAYGDRAAERLAHSRFPDLESEPVAPGWEDRWREFHVPAVVGPFWVGPPWERPPGGSTPVVIDPGRAFGTGAHATTRLCLAFVAELDRGALLDVGCGSGVVAVAAAKRGFAPVVAVDVDPAAVEATVRNAAANDVELDVRLADALAAELPAADVAVANIALDAVEAVAGGIDTRLYVTSGYLEPDRPLIARFRHRDRRVLDGWAADLFERV